MLLTFGLLSPDKGLEEMIEALPAIVEQAPDVLYVIAGATHPHLVAQEGDAYRDCLSKRAIELDVRDHVRFVNRFMELDELTDWLSAADVYITPYRNPAQITSGTLAYAVGMGESGGLYALRARGRVAGGRRRSAGALSLTGCTGDGGQRAAIRRR